MKKKSNNITSVKHLCVGLTLCCAAVGAQAAPTDNAMETSNYVSAVTQQTKKITGVVVDETGFPVIGANIIEKGTTNGVITDLDGNFSLEVPDGAIIEISYIGYTTQEIPVKGQTNFNIKLVEDTQKIDEVVVTALGIKRQSRSLGYSTTQVQGEDFTLARDPNLGNALCAPCMSRAHLLQATGKFQNYK